MSTPDFSQLSTGLFWLMPENIAWLTRLLLPGAWVALAGGLILLCTAFVLGVQRPQLNGVALVNGRVPERVYVQLAWASMAAGLSLLVISALTFSHQLGVFASAMSQFVVGGTYVHFARRASGAGAKERWRS